MATAEIERPRPIRVTFGKHPPPQQNNLLNSFDDLPTFVVRKIADQLQHLSQSTDGLIDPDTVFSFHFFLFTVFSLFYHSFSK